MGDRGIFPSDSRNPGHLGLIAESGKIRIENAAKVQLEGYTNMRRQKEPISWSIRSASDKAELVSALFQKNKC